MRALATRLTFLLLGPPQIKWEDAPLPVARRQVRALLYCLADDLRPVPRDRLAFLLWPDIPDAVARRNLIRLLSYARQALPDAVLLHADHTAVTLDPAHVQSDAAHFGALCAAEDAAAWETASTLYRGPFLDGFTLPESPEYGEWLHQAQRQHERAYLELLRKLVAVKTELADHPAAIQYAQQFLAVDALAEEMHRQLIDLYAASGQRSAALQQFETCAIVLERELGVPPLPETRAAYEQARDRGLPATPAPQTTPVWATLPGLHLPLAGREKEWQALAAAYRDRRRGGVILLAGEAGVGKSRLMQEFATAQGALTLTGAGHAAGQALPYQPLVQALRQALPLRERWRRTRPIWLAELSRLLPELHSHFDNLPQPVAVAPAQAQPRLFEALSQTFFALAGDSPLLLCLDDLHWADDATLGWLAYVTARLAGSGVCILGAYRSLEAGRLADWQRTLQRAGMAASLPVEPLTEQAVAELVGCAGAETATTPSLAAAIHAATGGNAFFVLETIREAATTGQLAAGATTLPLAQGVRDAVLRRVRRMTPLAQQLLATAAVLAPHVRFGLLMESAGRSEAETEACLEELIAHQLLQADGAVFRFHHDLAQQAVYADLSPWRRRLLHQRAAECLAHLPRGEQDGLAATIARHDAAAGDTMQAVEQFRRAAAYAQQIFVHQEAVDHLQSAIDLAQTQPTMADILPYLYEARADNLAILGRFAEAEAACRTALSLVAPGERLRRARLQRKLAKTLLPQPRTEEAAALFQAALGLLAGRSDREAKEERLELLFGQMDALYFQLRAEEMAALEGQLRALIEEAGSAAHQVRLFSQLNKMALIRERYRPSAATVALIRTALAHADAAGDRWEIAHQQFGVGFHLLWQGDLAGAEAALDEALALAANLGDQLLQLQCLVYFTVLHRLRGDTRKVHAYLLRLEAPAQVVHTPLYLAALQANTGWLHYRNGDWHAAQEATAAALANWDGTAYPFRWLAYWTQLALAQRQDTLPEAVAAARAMLAPGQQRQHDEADGALARIIQAADTGDAASVQTCLTQAVDLAARYGYL